jgi:hypothetical protein
MSHHGCGSMLVACAMAVGVSGAFMTGCTSPEDERARATHDAGDASSNDASSPSEDANGAPSDAGAILVDASVPAVSCAATPCAVEIAAGFDSACVRLSDGTVRCWGSNAAGELGRGDVADSSATAPAPVIGLNDVIQLSGSASLPGDVYCALRSGGAVVCWGSNENGVLGRSSDGEVDITSSGTPAPIAGLATATGVFAGHHVACATLAGNDVACWGSNAAAQIPGHAFGGGELFGATAFSIGAKSKTLALADRGTVALTDRGLVSWGRSGDPLGPGTGVLGREASTDVSSPEAIELAHVSAVVANAGRACAVANGRVFCWGAGPISGSDSVYPTYAGVGSTTIYAQTLAVGPRSACATTSDGAAICWGDNTRGQLGGGDFDLKPTPVRVQKLAGTPVRMAVMKATTCAILATGAVQCWGQNDKGQLGTGTADALPHLEPQDVVLTP